MITALSESVSCSSAAGKRSRPFSPEAAGARLTPKQLVWIELVEKKDHPDLISILAVWAPLTSLVIFSPMSLFASLHSSYGLNMRSNAQARSHKGSAVR
ncbi:hypothetical protein PBY51_018635 [Eleginops maclovinus]|uniref:Uncharacterized protein n=1 Tax=Eleginops maclovinus TaxID=56733 RepID=A0AAN7Y861_ELEMC|nr:hypothetical protein PBY51_018635 [Eleginops maclovinus]